MQFAKQLSNNCQCARGRKVAKRIASKKRRRFAKRQEGMPRGNRYTGWAD